MRNFLFIILCLTISLNLQAQNLFNQAKQDAYEELSDPDAKAILDKVKAQYDSYNNMVVTFNLNIEGGEVPEVHKGKVYIEGEKYRLEMTDQDIISNGKTIWFHIKGENEEVQINNPDPEENEYSPTSLMKIYEKDMIYALMGEIKENNKTVHIIEFKPKDSDSEFFKYRVSIDKNTNEVTKVIAFSRDASRYIIEFEEVLPNQELAEDIFNFDIKKHPNAHVEDLRVE